MRRLILADFVACGLLLALLAGCSSKGYLAEKLYWKAEELARTLPKDPKLITAQDYQKLIKAYQRVVVSCPLEPLAAQSEFIIAQIYVLRNQYSQAEKELIKITRNFSKNQEIASRAQFMLGNFYEHKGNWDKAISEYEKVTDLFPLSSIGLKIPIYIAEHQPGKDEIQTNMAYQKASKHYKKIISEYSGTSVATVVNDYLALTYVSQGKWNEAIDIWQAIANEYPQTQLAATSLFSIGDVYVRQIKDLEKAIQVYEDFVQKNPTSKIIKQTKFQIGRLYFMKGDFTKAADVFAKMIKDYPKEIELCTNAQLAIAACYERQGNWDKTMQTYRKLTHDYPHTRAALSVPLFIAQHHLRKNQLQDAERAFQEAISGYEKLIRENTKTALAAEAQDLISLVYVTQQKWSKAVDSLMTLIDTYPKNPKASASLFTIAAIYQRQLQEPKKAFEIYEKFIGQYPRHTLGSLAKSEMGSLQKSISK